MAARPHDMIAERDGSYWLMCDDIQTVDLSSVGLSTQARVTGTAVQHISAAGSVLFEWTPFGKIPVDLTRLSVADRTAPAINWTHGNAIDIDTDGNVLLSFRNLSEIVKINAETGAIIWHLGGTLNDFKMQDGTGPSFAGQHGVRTAGAGRIQLLDNLGVSGGSQAEVYAYDEKNFTTVMTASYPSVPPVIAPIGGSTQKLANVHTLVSFGNGGSVAEYDGNGKVAWKMDGNPGYVFHAQRILSLYRPGQDYAR
jgi:Arylsulfotransferase (ASST).